MAEPGAVTRTLLDRPRSVSDDRGLAALICQACVDGLDIDGASMSVLTTTPSRETVWATDPVAELLEDLQFTLNEGACIQAATTGEPVYVPDLRTSTDALGWPMFAAAVAEQTSVLALFALPLRWGPVNLGVLDLYRCAPGGLPDTQWRDAVAATDTATLMMIGHRTEPDADDSARAADEWLDRSLGHRAEVHQATGMVLAQLAITAPDALARLRAHAFAHQRPLLDVARDVVARRLVFTEDMT